MERFRRLVLLALMGMAVLPARAQSNEPWRVYTAMRRVTALAASGDSVLWAATSGGIFRYRLASREVQRYTTAEGLSGRDARAITVDARRGTVWVGYAGGVLDRLDVTTGVVTTLRDIERATRFPQRDVTRLSIAGDTLYAATTFGLVAFDPVRGVVRESYTQFGSLAAGQPAHDAVRAIVDGQRVLAVAVEGGVALGPLDGRNLQDPASWRVETAGLPSTTVQRLVVRGGTLYAGTNSGVAARTGPRQWGGQGGTQGIVRDLAVDGAALIAADESALAVFEGTTSARTPSGLTAPQALIVTGGRVWAGDAARGLVGFRRSGTALAPEAPVVPPGPYDNAFATLSFAPDGTLWAAGTGGGEAGLYRLGTDGLWTSFTPATVPNFPDGQAVVAATSDAGAWGGAFGKGAVRMLPDGSYVRYTTANASLRPSAANDPQFVIVDGIGVDSKGHTWFTNKQAPAPYHVRTADGTWAAVPLPVENGYEPSYVGLSRVFVDRFDQKWIIVQNEQALSRGRGLLVHSSGNTPANASDDAVRFFPLAGGGAGRGFPATAAGASEVLLAVTEDRRGRLWAGTDKGLAYLQNTSVVARDASAAFSWPRSPSGADGTALFNVLFGLRINALAVDAADGLWAGTDEGVYRVAVQDDGFAVTDHFTVDNAPLPANRVIALAVSPQSGHVFIATEQGLVAYTNAATPVSVAPAPLFVYPNPVRASQGPVRVTIRGLVADAAVRILAPDGRVVRMIQATGGSVEWDGRSDDGQDVTSGVYVVAAVGTQGAAYGKVAVLR